MPVFMQVDDPLFFAEKTHQIGFAVNGGVLRWRNIDRSMEREVVILIFDPQGAGIAFHQISKDTDHALW